MNLRNHSTFHQIPLKAVSIFPLVAIPQRVIKGIYERQNSYKFTCKNLQINHEYDLKVIGVLRLVINATVSPWFFIHNKYM